MQLLCNGKMRVSLPEQVVDGLIALDEPGPRLLLASLPIRPQVSEQWGGCRGRSGHQVNRFERLAMLAQNLLDHFGQVAQHMEAITTHQLDAGVVFEPGSQGGSLTVREEIHWEAILHIDEHRAVFFASPIGPFIHAKNGRRLDNRCRLLTRRMRKMVMREQDRPREELREAAAVPPSVKPSSVSVCVQRVVRRA